MIDALTYGTMQIGLGKRSLSKSGVNMLHALCIIGLSCLAISCGMFRHSPKIIYDYNSNSKVSISVLDKELNYMPGDTLLINAEIYNGADTDLLIAPTNPCWELHYPTEYDVDNLCFISIGGYNAPLMTLKPGEKTTVKCRLMARSEILNGFKEGKYVFNLYFDQTNVVGRYMYQYRIKASNELIINIVKGK